MAIFQLRTKKNEGPWPVLAAQGQASALLVNIRRGWTCQALTNKPSCKRYDTGHNNIQHNDTQHNDNQQFDIQHYDIQDNYK